MKIFKKIFLLFFFLALFTSILTNFCLAEDRPLEIQYPIIGDIQAPAYVTTLLSNYVRYIFYLVISIAGLIAFGALIYGGVRYLASGGNPAAMSDAKDQIFAGILGLILLLSSYLVLNTINPQLITLKSPELTIVPTPTITPTGQTGKICLYDKKCGESERKILNCFSGEYPNKPASENIYSAEINEAGIALAFYESYSYNGRRICLKKDVVTNGCGLCDLTKCDFGTTVGIGADITDDINSLRIIPAEECCQPGVAFPQASKEAKFCADVLTYKEADFKGPVVLPFSEGGVWPTKPPSDIKSIEIKNSSLAVRLWEKENYRGKSICFNKSIKDLSQCYFQKLILIFNIGWDVRIGSIQVISKDKCPDSEAGKTYEENEQVCGSCGDCQ